MKINRLLYFIIIVFCLAAQSELAQNSSLYLPLNIQNAVKKGTRTLTGKPGPNYWQNKSEYEINAELIPDSSLLRGIALIKYFNNSPDTLNSIVLRLYQDLHRKGVARDFSIGPFDLHDGVYIHYLVINDDSIIVENRGAYISRTGTNVIVNLKKHLFPGTKLEIKVKWEFKIPRISPVRMGNYGDGEFFIAYWYPQIAVYDDIDGWDQLEYWGYTEFYNDFSDFEFNITLPGKYIVWATGELQNPDELFTKTILDRIIKANQSDDVVHIATKEDYENDDVIKKNEKNIWFFKAEHVPDISFAVSDDYMWDAASVVVDSSSGRRVTTSAVYQMGAVYYDQAAYYSRMTVEYLSHELPGIPFEYPHATTFYNKNSGGGMEFPMMANNGAPENRGSFVGLIFHEISHNYFPFMMGANERKYGWMDEGWARFFPYKIVNQEAPEFDYLKTMLEQYERVAGNESEMPMMIPSYSLRGNSFRTACYSRPHAAYEELSDLLGYDLFKKALQEYMFRWMGKHPVPIDFFYTFNEVAGENLEWFWKPWFYEFGYPDLGIKDVQVSKEKAIIIIEKNGNIPTQVLLMVDYENGNARRIERPASVWKNGNKVYEIEFEPEAKIKRVRLGNLYIPDVNDKNNFFEF